MDALLRRRRQQELIEKEIKLELANREDFDRALSYFTERADKTSRDTLLNHYLDTEDLRLAHKLIMIRVRAAQKNILTYKNGTQVEAGYFRSTEIETELDGHQLEQALARPATLFDQDLAPMQELTREFGELDLRLIGTLENERSKLDVEGHRVELDRMRFPDGSEAYEIELESEEPEKARAWCLEKLAEAGIKTSPSTRTKFHRLLIKMGKAPET